MKNSPRVRSYPNESIGSRREGSERWEIAIVGDLTEKQFELVERIVELPRRSAGIIWFDSCGGSVYSGLAIAVMIKLRGLRAAGIVAGECSSAALLPYAACETRYVTPYSTLLFHQIRWQSDEQMRLQDAAEWARHFESLEQESDRLLAEMFSCRESLLAEWNKAGRFVSGPELVEAGLAQMLDVMAGDFWRHVERR